ncbi:hypothetical protein ACEN8K_39100, partial [Variovorax sp. CT11-76]
MRDAPDPLAAPAAPEGTVAARVDAALRQWSDQPWAYDYFAVLRRLEAAEGGGRERQRGLLA